MGKRVGRTEKRRAKIRRRLLVERLGDRRVLASITGAVFDDANHSFQLDPGEANAPSRLIYVDVNDNAELDTGESFVVAGPDGTFEFPNVADGTYKLRMFNGTQTQTQSYPVEATIDGGTLSVTGASQLEILDGSSLALTSESLVVGDTAEGTSQTISVGNELSKMQTLPDGTLLVIGTEAGGETSWIVDPKTATVTPIDLSGLDESTPQIRPSIPWADVAIDGQGRGVLLEQSGSGIVRAIDASGTGIRATTTSNLVPADTQVVTSDTGNRTVFAWSGTDELQHGMQFSLWSNVTESFITSPTPPVSGITGLLAFDDASGLLAVRTDDGGVSVHSVDDNFATLHTLNEGAGPIAIDGARDLLLTVSPVDDMLKVINLQDGELVADLAIDLSEVGQVASLALNENSDALVVIGAAGIIEVALQKAAAHEVTITDGQDSDPILFGISLSGSNTPPTYSTPPTFETTEDITLTLAAPAALNDSSDAEDDGYVVAQRSQPANGTATIQIDGAVSYVPNPDFNGTDSLVVMLHDGRDASEVTLNFNVDSVPDTPSGVNATIDPVPEGILPGQPIGDIEVIDADGIDGGGHIIDIDDPRFKIKNGQIIFIGGQIDFESEPELSVGVSVTDNDTDDTIETVIAVTIRDENEPVTDIEPSQAELPENDPGYLIEQLVVIDEDNNPSHTLTVDDDRFIIREEDNFLKLKDGISVDFEKEPIIVLNVTVTDGPDGGTFTKAITIHVIDLEEQPESIELSNDSVMELMPGDVVGDVTVDGSAASSGRFEFTVDDPRFEIDGTTLKLLDDQFVERASQAEIELTITTSDTQSEYLSISQKFVIQVLENETPYHNRDNPYDVDHSGDVTALDALAIINYLNTFGPGPVGQGDPGFCYDVNADRLVTALDALLVLNEMNRISNGGGGTVGGEREGEDAEGEQVAGNDEAFAQPDQVADDQRSGSQPNQERFDTLTEPAKRISDAPDYDSYDVAGPAIEIPSHSSSEEFAENVDDALRTLSDKNC